MKEKTTLKASHVQQLLDSLQQAQEELEALGAAEDPAAEHQAKSLAIAFRHARSAVNRLGSLWAAAQLAAGKFQPNLKPIHPRELLEDAVREVSASARARDLELTTKFEASSQILGDRQLLTSLLADLLTNLVRVASPGTQIVVSTFNHEENVVIKLEDGGEGITNPLVPGLVEGGQREEGSAETRGDLPTLGAYGVKPIVEAHGGELWAEREEDSGRALFLSFPASIVESKETTKAENSVLIVDDDPDSAFMLEQVLAKGGFATEIAHNGLSGLAKAKAGGISLVLLDVMLPGMDGFEVCHRLREDPATAELPIVMVSAKSRPEDRETGLRMGADDYLTKPLRLSDVIDRVTELIEERAKQS